MFIIIENESAFVKVCNRRGWDADAYIEEIEGKIEKQGIGCKHYDIEYPGDAGVYADKVKEIHPQRVKVKNAETGDERIIDRVDIPKGYEIVDVVLYGVYRFIEDERITEEEERIDEVNDYFGHALRD